MVKMPIYYINLASAPARRREMERQFAELGLAAERVEAVTPAQISPEDIQTYCNPARYRWVAPTELACSLSHVKVWSEILRSGAKHALILEDDAVLSSHLPDFLNEVDQQDIPAGLIKLEVCPDNIRADGEPRKVVGEIGLRRVFGFSRGTAAYIVSNAVASQTIARREIRDSSVDRALFDSFGKLSRELGFLQADPGLAIQADQLPGNPSAVENSAIKPDLRTRFEVRSSSLWPHWTNAARRWIEENIGVGLRKSCLDLAGVNKRKIEFLP